MNDLRITYLQTSLAWENKAENLQHFAHKIAALKDPCDVIVLPEMFSTGFSMNSHQLAEKMNGETVSWMKKNAAVKNCVLCGSVIIEEDGAYYNRFIWMQEDGQYSFYDKRHLFRMAKENEHFSAGNKKVIVDYKEWKICLQVCYDLRFPVWSRRTEKENYDVLLYVANWPERRNHAWKSLLIARAIENQCYVVGVNRIGMDGNDINYCGDSVVLDFLGEKLSLENTATDSVESILLSKQKLLDFRKGFPAELDGDVFRFTPEA